MLVRAYWATLADARDHYGTLTIAFDILIVFVDWFVVLVGMRWLFVGLFV